MLAFYPTSAALPIRSAIVGLAQAFSTFSSSFSSEVRAVRHSSPSPLCKTHLLEIPLNATRNAVLAQTSSPVASAAGNVRFMECELRRWAMLEAEPNLWLVLVVSKAWAGPGCSNAALSSSLSALHSLFVLLHRPLSQMVDQVWRGWVGCEHQGVLVERSCVVGAIKPCGMIGKMCGEGATICMVLSLE